MAHLATLQALAVCGILGGFLGIMFYAWAHHTVKSIITHRNARKQKNG